MESRGGLDADDTSVHVGINDFWKKVVIVSIVIIIAITMGFRFAVAPPLLVAFTEFCNPQAKPRKQPGKAIALVTLCAGTGALFRFVMTISLGLPLTVSAFFAAIVAITLIKSFKLYIPPAAAMMLLAMLIPSEMVVVYPLHVCVGISIFMLAARKLF